MRLPRYNWRTASADWDGRASTSTPGKPLWQPTPSSEPLREHTRLGIPAFFIDEALHGLMAYGSTSFPQAIGLASTWDPELVQEVFPRGGIRNAQRAARTTP